MAVARLFIALMLATAAIPAGAQVPTRPPPLPPHSLPVLDDYGEVISEDLIRATIRGKGRRAFLNPLFGALAGAIVFAGATGTSRDCTIYDPCTPKEEFYLNGGPIVGMLVGTLVGAALPDGSVDRYRAVEIIRAKRRAARTTGTP